MARWIEKEHLALDEMRSLLSAEIASLPLPFPDVVGDRKLIRFLRGRDGNPVTAAKQYSEFLIWYQQNNVAEIRRKILYEGINHPHLFPLGARIIELAPQIVIAPRAFDFRGQPITLEMYGFNPSEVLSSVSIEQYLEFLIYTLEYRSLILEQLSHEREAAYCLAHPDPCTRVDGYGVTIMTCTIRDLKGISSFLFSETC